MQIKYAAGIGWFVFCAYAFSDAGINVLFIILAVHITGIWLAHWLFRLMRFLRLTRKHPDTRENLKHQLLPWCIEPLVLIVVGVLAGSGVLADMRFAASLHSMNAYAGKVRRGEVNLNFEWFHPTRDIGLYSTSLTELLEDGTVRFITSSAGLMDRAGFAHSPNSEPMRQGEDSYTHLYGKWWIWRKSW